jgi:DinB superfamily
MDAMIAGILRSWQYQRDYAVKLVADLSDGDMVSQPVAGVVMNHPAWVYGHCGIYPPVLAAMLEGKPFEDPIKHRYGRDSRPTGNRADYPSKEVIVGEFLAGHDRLAEVLGKADAAVMARPIPLERWKQRFPTIADAVAHLMLEHEAGHLGQVSAGRGAGGRPAV